MSKIIGLILNFIGAFFRWSYGTILRTILNKNKFPFENYKNGSIISNEWVDKPQHTHINKIIGFIFLVIVILLIKYFLK